MMALKSLQETGPEILTEKTSPR